MVPPFPALAVIVFVLIVKFAVIEVFAVTVTEQEPVPEHPPPDQPVKVEPVAGVALSVTDVPELNEKEQVEPQEMPVGFDETVPAPVPPLATDNG
jgi:hypothetical protein